MCNLHYSPFLRFCTIFSVRGQERSFLNAKSEAWWCKLNLYYIRADAALCAEAMDASTGVLCIVSEIGAKLFLARLHGACAKKKRAR
jgi:hypothetical protein